ncbi:MAG: T9SS type A sorting domain-containing protein [Paludibacter sp.]
MKNNTMQLIRIVSAILLSIFGSSVFAATVTYTAGATGNWTDANWTPSAPVAGDNVVIAAGAVVTVNTDLSTIKLNSLSVLGTLTIETTGSITVEQTSTVNPIINVGGGTFINNGTFSVKQTLAASNAAINLANGTDADSKFINNGTLNIDMMASTIASSSTRCIYLSQTTANRTPRVTLGGTMNFAVPTGTRFFELGAAANAVIDGTAVFGSVSDYKNWRLIHMGNSGTLTLAGSIEFYSGYVSANGVISQSVTGTASAVGTLVNSGTLTIHGMSGSTGSYAIYLNAQRAGTASPYTYGTAKFKNTGTLTLDGNYPTSYGAIYLNGNPGATDEFRNEGVINVTNTGAFPAISCQIANALTASIINSGTMTLNTTGAASIVLGDANSSITNTGAITVNKLIAGYAGNTTVAVVNNNANGVFNFNVALSTDSIINRYKVVFNNNGGKVAGKGIFKAGTFVPSTGTLSPGGDAGVGIFTFSDPSLVLTGTCKMNINGTAVAGVDYDQINSTGTLDISGTTLDASVGYSPANSDLVPLIGFTARTGTFSSVINAPSKWVSNYTATNANLLYDTSTEVTGKLTESKIIVRNGQIMLNTNQSIQCSVTDILGRVVRTTVFNSASNSLSISGLKGIYIVRLSTEKGNYSHKINL